MASAGFIRWITSLAESLFHHPREILTPPPSEEWGDSTPRNQAKYLKHKILLVKHYQDLGLESCGRNTEVDRVLKVVSNDELYASWPSTPLEFKRPADPRPFRSTSFPAAMAKLRNAAHAEEKADVEVLCAQVARMSETNKKLQALQGRLVDGGSTTREALGPVHSNTRDDQIMMRSKQDATTCASKLICNRRH